MKGLRIATLAALPISFGLAAAVPGEPLDPEQAFPAFAALTAAASGAPHTGVDVSFRIAEGYYLYRDKFRIAVEGPGLALGDPRLPPGEAKDDPFMGRTEILHRYAVIQWPFKGEVRPGEYVLKVTAQGCLTDKVCYAPFTQSLKIKVP
jgi:thiol:disulfide interchange protein DsbD